MIPEGYEKLAVIGIAWKGDYVADTAYKLMNAVYYNGSTYVALKDNPVTPPDADNANWTYLAKGFINELLSSITAIDTSGVVGAAGGQVAAQTLIDAVADKVMTKLIEKNKLVNNLLSTDPTTALSGPMGKALDDKIAKLNGDLSAVERALPHKAPSLLAITKTDPSTCSLLFYDNGNGNWAGLGCDNGGNVMVRVGLSDSSAKLYQIANTNPQ